MSQNKISKLIVAVLLIIIIGGCNSGKGVNDDPDNNKPNSNGKTSELLVVTGEMYWKGKIGKTIREFFRKPYEVIPQYEPAFTTPNIPPNKVKSKMFRIHRCIFIVDIDPTVSRTITETKKNLWSAPQRVIKITAKDENAFIKEFNDHKETFYALYHEIELERINRSFRSAEDLAIRRSLEKKYDLSMVFPLGYFIAKSHDDFVWIRKETPNYSQAILISTFPYTDTSVFANENIVKRRNALTKRHVPGPTDGSYMITSKTIFPTSKAVNFKGMYAIETKGLWEVANDFMGGPFISYTFVDQKRQRVIVVDGYVYAPKDGKRDLIKQMEAIIHTIEIKE